MKRFELRMHVSQRTFGGLRLRSLSVIGTTLRGVAMEQYDGGWRWYLRYANGGLAGEGESPAWAGVAAGIKKALDAAPQTDAPHTGIRLPSRR